MGLVTILWLKRDLRIADHPAMAFAACHDEAVLPLYVVEPEYWALPDASARQWEFVSEGLQSLREDLASLGAPLVVRVGDIVSVLETFHRRRGIRRLVSHEETGNLWTFGRDRRVAAWARGRGVPWTELPQCGVVRRLASRDGWAARRERWLDQGPLAPPRALAGHGEEPGMIPPARDLGLTPDPCPQRQTGGRQAGLRLLRGFLDERGRDYRRAMSAPASGERACSRLSPHLALGTLSVREVHHATQRRLAEVRGARDGWVGSLTSFQARLAWRDHFVQKLEDTPRIETHCLHSAYEAMRPREPDRVRLDAWQRGETGLPFVDACMRYLAATGWLNFRMRSMLMAVASYHLWLDWRATGHHLARMFTDYEPGIHWPQVQMQSGTTGMNTIRIYNPVKQGRDHDPHGTFTRRWVPELAEVPDAFVHEPWRWEGAGGFLGRRYPEPVVDVAAAARQARDAVWGVRRGAEFRAEADLIIRRHASRKDTDAGRHFVDDRAPRLRKATDHRQMSLDL